MHNWCCTVTEIKHQQSLMSLYFAFLSIGRLDEEKVHKGKLAKRTLEVRNITYMLDFRFRKHAENLKIP